MKINFVIIFTNIIYTLFVSSRFSVVEGSCGHHDSPVQLTADVFQCLYYWLLLTYLCYSNSQSRYNPYQQKQPSCSVLLKWFQMSFINSLKFIIYSKFIQKFIQNLTRSFENKCEGVYTFPSWQDNTDYLEHLFTFKQIVPVSLSILSLKRDVIKSNLIHFSKNVRELS